MKTVSKRLLSLTAFLLSVSLFAVSAEAAGSPQTSVSNSGEEFDAHLNQPVQTTQTSPAYEGTGLTKRSFPVSYGVCYRLPEALMRSCGCELIEPSARLEA